MNNSSINTNHTNNGNALFSNISIDATTGKCIINNPNIFPVWLSENTEYLIKTIAENVNKIKEDDRQLYKLIYKRIMRMSKGYVISEYPIEFVINIEDDGEHTPYKFILYTLADGKVTGHVYKNCMRELNQFVIDRTEVESTKSLSRFKMQVIDTLKNNKDRNIAIIQVDIDGFKSLNSIFGEETCDKILEYIGSGLCMYANGAKYVIRQSSDIFNIIYSYTNEAELIESIEVWDTNLSEYNDIKYRLTWGVYTIENTDSNVRNMIDCAIIARKSVKGNALNNIGVYSQEQKEKINKVKIIESKMFSALENKEFEMFIQPKYDIQSNKIIGGEALIRWIEKDGTVISPCDFIPIFEQNGFILYTDRFIWEEACKLLHRLQSNNIELVPISVNVSRRNLDNSDFINFFDELVDKYNISKKYIQIEITESFDDELSQSVLLELRKHGFKLLMDDFGSGYSSLNTLRNTDFDIIKLDREFLSSFMSNDRGQKIIAHTISMINDIKLGVIAEGVETAEQAKFLRDNGCTEAQGFLYSKPITIAEFENLIKNNVR